jgi:hypothetical protein
MEEELVRPIHLPENEGNRCALSTLDWGGDCFIYLPKRERPDYVEGEVVTVRFLVGGVPTVRMVKIKGTAPTSGGKPAYFVVLIKKSLN